MQDQTVFPRLIDRILFVTIGIFATLGGIYLLVLPLGIENVNNSAIVAAIISRIAVVVLGSLAVLDGIALAWCGFRKEVNINFLTWVLFFSFMLRLYSTIGAIIAQGSILPPTWTSNAVLIVVTGAYFVIIKVRAHHR